MKWQIDREKMSRYALPIMAIVAILFVWQAVFLVITIPKYILVPPSEVVRSLVAKWSVYADHGWSTLQTTVVGFVIAVIGGFGVAIIMSLSHFMQNTLYPLVVITKAIPKVVLAPIFMIWFGYGFVSQLVMVFLIAFFPMVINGLTGLLEVDADLLEMATTMHADRWNIFKKIRLPNSLPYVVAGMKIAIIMAVIGAVVAEFVGATKGLGYLVLAAEFSMDISMMFGSAVLLCLMGLGLFGVITLLERLLIRWQRPSEIVV